MILPELSESFPPDRIPTGRVPDGVNPFNSRTLSLSSLNRKMKKKRFYRWVFTGPFEKAFVCNQKEKETHLEP